MGRKLRTVVGMLHPDSTNRVLDKQDKQKSSNRQKSFKIGDKFYAKDYSSCGIWILVTVMEITGLISILQAGDRFRSKSTMSCQPTSFSDNGIYGFDPSPYFLFSPRCSKIQSSIILKLKSIIHNRQPHVVSHFHSHS